MKVRKLILFCIYRNSMDTSQTYDYFCSIFLASSYLVFVTKRTFYHCHLNPEKNMCYHHHSMSLYMSHNKLLECKFSNTSGHICILMMMQSSFYFEAVSKDVFHLGMNKVNVQIMTYPIACFMFVTSIEANIVSSVQREALIVLIIGDADGSTVVCVLLVVDGGSSFGTNAIHAPQASALKME